jgi:hypothetical protein
MVIAKVGNVTLSTSLGAVPSLRWITRSHPIALTTLTGQHPGAFAMLKAIAFATVALAMAPAAWALETAQAHVTAIESTYMPGSVHFTVDVGTASCPAGTWLIWSNASVDNVKSAFALLLSATNTGNQIQYFINNGDTTCLVQFLHALSS